MVLVNKCICSNSKGEKSFLVIFFWFELIRLANLPHFLFFEKTNYFTFYQEVHFHIQI